MGLEVLWSNMALLELHDKTTCGIVWYLTLGWIDPPPPWSLGRDLS